MSGDALMLLLPDGTQAQARGDANGYLLTTPAVATATPGKSIGEAVQLLLPDGTQAQMRGDASGYLILTRS